jgi:hypothetical protein
MGNNTYYRFSKKNRKGLTPIESALVDAIFRVSDAFMIQENSFGDIEVSGGNWYGCFSIENDDTLLSYSITDKYDELTIDGIYGVRTISSIHPVDDIIMLISRDIFRVKAMEYFITYIDESFIRKSLISDRSVVCQVEEGMKVEIFGISRVIGYIEFDDHDISSTHVVVSPEGGVLLTMTKRTSSAMYECALMRPLMRSTVISKARSQNHLRNVDAGDSDK